MNALNCIALFILIAQPMSGTAKAAQGPSHTAEVDLELGLVDSKGKVERLSEENARFSLSWDSGKCQLGVKGRFAYCALDLSQDLKSVGGELLVSSVPTAHFTAETISSLMVLLGRDSAAVQGTIKKVASESEADRAKGFELPFYTCEACQPTAKTAGKTPIWNAYDSFVSRQMEIKHAALNGKTLVLKFKLHNMKAYGGAFHIVGNNDAGNFGSH